MEDYQKIHFSSNKKIPKSRPSSPRPAPKELPKKPSTPKIVSPFVKNTFKEKAFKEPTPKSKSRSKSSSRSSLSEKQFHKEFQTDEERIINIKITSPEKPQSLNTYTPKPVRLNDSGMSLLEKEAQRQHSTTFKNARIHDSLSKTPKMVRQSDDKSKGIKFHVTPTPSASKKF